MTLYRSERLRPDTSGELDDEDDLLELNAGYFFNPHFGLEASATWFGEYGGSLASAGVYGYGLAAVRPRPPGRGLFLLAEPCFDSRFDDFPR
ncbi:hypothetical protein [Marinimicrobium alkaliphilum]|uniref:hypothetical protein n=1 Tax=Marinimicrobium alkaliphilum TaxID=2202654 RepID=UPI0013007DE4|nr:hypothetical protein [Marinimicrobium alkaliphilum]